MVIAAVGAGLDVVDVQKMDVMTPAPCSVRRRDGRPAAAPQAGLTACARAAGRPDVGRRDYPLGRRPLRRHRSGHATDVLRVTFHHFEHSGPTSTCSPLACT